MYHQLRSILCYTLITFSPISLAGSSHSSTLSEKIDSCGKLLEEIRKSDCGNHIVDIFDDGYISAGAAGYTLSATPRFDNAAAQFSSGLFVTPNISINTRLNYFPNTDLGWDFSVGWEQAHALTQTVHRSQGSTSRDLGTFAIANTFSSEVSIFYAYGTRDATPHRYALFGVGFGVGYADVVGKAYFTEDLDSSEAACIQAGEDLVDGIAGAEANVKASCSLKSFRRFGLGVSGKVNLDVRWDNFYLTIDSKIINLSSGRSLSLGSSGMELSPNISAITLSYLYNL